MLEEDAVTELTATQVIAIANILGARRNSAAIITILTLGTARSEVTILIAPRIIRIDRILALGILNGLLRNFEIEGMKLFKKGP